MLMLDFDTVNFLVNATLCILGILPFIINLKYSYQFKVVDYLLLSIYFSYWGPLGLLIEATGSLAYSTEVFPYAALWNEPLFLFAFTNICECLPIYLLAIRSKWVYPPIRSYLVTIFPFFLVIIVSIDNNQTIINGYPILFWCIWISRILFYGVSCYIFLHIGLINQTKRAIYSKYIWIESTFLMAIAMLFVMIVCGILGIQQTNSDPYAVLNAFIMFVIMSIAFLSFIILHLFFPEAILLSDEQLRNAKKIYNVIYAKKKRENKVVQLGFNIFKQYLDGIPDEFMKEINGEKSFSTTGFSHEKDRTLF